MIGMRTDEEFLIGNRLTLTDIYRVEYMFEMIRIMEERIRQLLRKGDGACDEVKKEFVHLNNTYELLKEKIQGQNF